MNRVFLYTLLISFIFTPQLVLKAQTLSPLEDPTGGVNIVAVPETPGPNQNVSLILDSSTVDLDSAIITWKVNGTQTVSKKGQKRFDTRTGALGTAIFISASISSGSKVFQVSMELIPGGVDLLVQGRGYTPAFYKGRSLWATQGAITILAIPHVVRGGQELGPSSLIYRWTKDGTVLGNSSGVGKNSLSFASSILSQPTIVSVDVLTNQSTVVASDSINLSPIAPKILTFEDNPLYGLMLHYEVSGAFPLKEKEVSFKAVPLFFSTLVQNSNSLNFAWTSNGVSVNQEGNRITFRAPSDSAGSSVVSVAIDHKTKPTQSAQKSFTVQFDQQSVNQI